MSATVIVVGPRDKDIPKGVTVISTVSKAKDSFWRQLSPFILGPCKLWGGHISQNMENGWQYSKVYRIHDEDGEPNVRWQKWSKEGWENPKAVRYPMGKGASPEYSWWDGKQYGYVQARAKIYIPLYARAVAKTEAFEELKKRHVEDKEIWLWDFDGYDRRKFGMSLLDVLTCPTKKMGHAFVLAMMLKWGENFWRR